MEKIVLFSFINRDVGNEESIRLLRAEVGCGANEDVKMDECLIRRTLKKTQISTNKLAKTVQLNYNGDDLNRLA